MHGISTLVENHLLLYLFIPKHFLFVYSSCIGYLSVDIDVIFSNNHCAAELEQLLP